MCILQQLGHSKLPTVHADSCPLPTHQSQWKMWNQQPIGKTSLYGDLCFLVQSVYHLCLTVSRLLQSRSGCTTWTEMGKLRKKNCSASCTWWSAQTSPRSRFECDLEMHACKFNYWTLFTSRSLKALPNAQWPKRTRIRMAPLTSKSSLGYVRKLCLSCCTDMYIYVVHVPGFSCAAGNG